MTAGLLIVVVVGMFTASTLIQAQNYDNQVRRSLVALSSVDALLLTVLEMNNAQRGYVLSGDAAFIERYRSERDNIENDLRKLTAILPAAGASRESIQTFERSFEQRMKAFEETDELIREGEFATAGRYSAYTRTNTDGVRRSLAVIKTQLFDSLSRQQQVSKRSSDRALFLMIAGLISAALLILISIIFLVRRSNEVERANAEIREMATNLERRVDERTADLAEANDEIQRFAYIVSHDLRSPLVNMMGFTAELEEAQHTIAEYVASTEENGAETIPLDVRAAVMEDMPEAMGFIRAATGRMDRLIKAILQISREGRRTLAAETVELDELFGELQDSLAGQLDAVGAEMTIGSLPQVHCDPLAMEQVFGNLLDNAIKYLRPGVSGRISVTGETQPGKVIVRIQDNGRGVAPHDQRRIFELFRRAGEQDQAGEGIGLAHVQALLRRLGGTIQLSSTLGEGSCFTVTLPLSMARGAR
ncbi:MAG TPA: ATP-binding protein [Erythrobacter sp.]|nr:ATP-binding protein [Erythrobacter sp.]